MSTDEAAGDSGLVKIDADGQGIDEHANDTIGAGAALHAAEKYGAEDDGGFIGDVGEDGGPG